MSLPLLSCKNLLKLKEGKVFDILRKKWIVLTPEELVRQLSLTYLIENFNISKNRFKVEKGITVNDLHKRYDYVLYDKGQKPMVLVECKSFKIKLNQKVIEQASRYNLLLKAPYIWITNGEDHLFFEINHQNKSTRQISSLEEILASESL